jgi:hypothetical protein
VGFAEPQQADHWTAGLDPGGVQHGFGLGLVGVADGWLVLGPVTAFRQERGPRTFEFGSRARDSVLQQVADLCKRYGATAYLDQHQAPQIVSRLKELGVVAYTVPQTREAKWLAFKELQARLYAGDLVLPRLDELLDELGRVQFKLEQGGAKIVLPSSAGAIATWFRICRWRASSCAVTLAGRSSRWSCRRT